MMGLFTSFLRFCYVPEDWWQITNDEPTECPRHELSSPFYEQVATGMKLREGRLGPKSEDDAWFRAGLDIEFEGWMHSHRYNKPHRAVTRVHIIEVVKHNSFAEMAQTLEKQGQIQHMLPDARNVDEFVATYRNIYGDRDVTELTSEGKPRGAIEIRFEVISTKFVR